MTIRSNSDRRVTPGLTLVATLVATASLLLIPAPTVAGNDAGKPSYNEAGALILPQGYREWIYVGAPLTPNDMNGGKAEFPEFHSVYINPQGYQGYKNTGTFPDGTIMLKELVSVGAKKATSGSGYFMGDYVAVAVSVKDSKQFPDEPGHWGFFSFGNHPNLTPTAEPLPTASCNGCHEASADEDWVFTQYYPVLRAAKPE